MQLKQWLETKADVPNTAVPATPNTTFSEAYATALLDAGIQDDEQDLPKVGLTWEDLKELGVAVGYRHRILKAIQKIAPPELKREGTDSAKDRHDLIKRFVPIALSVGFAARLVDINWVKKGTPITYDQWEQLARLFEAVAKRRDGVALDRRRHDGGSERLPSIESLQAAARSQSCACSSSVQVRHPTS
jgi:hypothetical protein